MTYNLAAIVQHTMYEYYHMTSSDKTVRMAEILDLVGQEARDSDALISTWPDSFYERFFTSEGALFGAVKGPHLIGFALLGFSTFMPQFWEPHLDNLGAEKQHCGVLRSTIVQRAYRKNGVGSTLLAMRIAHARSKGKKHLFATVDPRNRTTLRLLSEAGFSEIGQEVVYTHAVRRTLMYRRCKATPFCSAPVDVR